MYKADVMSKKFSYRALIDKLKKLHFKVSLMELNKRINSYHSNVSDGKRKHPGGIKAPLTEFIETTVAQATSSNHTNHSYDHLAKERKPEPHPAYPETPQPGQLSRERIDELSKYFKERNKGADLHPPIREKLEHSVWEHMHTAIRCARQGEESNAKIHLNIAHSACKELGHYMEEDEYQAFVRSAEEHMENLTNSQKKT